MAEETPAKVGETTTVAHPKTTPPTTNGLAIAAMVVGIVAFVSGWIPFWGLVAGIAAVVLGVLALKKPAGKGMSITGIVTGGIAALTNLFFIAFFIIALVAGSAVVDEAQNQIQKESASTQEMIDAQKDFAKGETATFGTYEVKVNSVTRNYVPESSFYQADDGKEYVVVNITVKNIGDESEYISAYSFTLNEAGLSTENAFVTVDPEFESGDLSPGATATGNIVYEVTKDATDLKLQYEVTVFDQSYSSKKLVYTLAI